MESGGCSIGFSLCALVLIPGKTNPRKLKLTLPIQIPHRLREMGTRPLINDFVTKFFDDRIGQDLAGHPFDLDLGCLACGSAQIEHEKFALAHLADLAE